MRYIVAVVCAGLLPAAARASSPAERAVRLVANMTLPEKLGLLHGWPTTGLYTGNVPGIERLGIPALKLNDGPQGFRDDLHPGTTTAWPSAMTLTATWDKELAGAFGEAMGTEFRGKGANVALGPGLNVARVPTGGRNFEYLSGEDPLLGVVLAPRVVRGLQAQGVIANAKHFVFNNQETDRFGVDAMVPERAAHEVYLPPFAAAVEAGVGSVMCSYNRITYAAHPQPGNASWACEDKDTLTHLLKEALGFRGWVVSDWGATHSTNESALHGLDQEMPGADYFGDALAEAVTEGAIREALIDEKAVRIVTSMVAVGLLDSAESNYGNLTANVTSPAHSRLAREIAAAAIVLLKNDGAVLPLEPASTRRVAVLGVAAHDDPIVTGSGSGRVLPAHVVTGLQGIQEVVEQSGGQVEYFASLSAAALAATSTADAAVVFVGTSSGEGSDRANLTLSETDNALVDAVLAVQPTKTIVVASTPGALVLGDWVDAVPAVLVSWLAGQEMGHACADILFGAVNPSGRLPVTFPHVDNEISFSEAQFPGLVDTFDAPDDCDQPCLMVNYSESLLVGHRYYAASNIEPKFPFGHGLSYTRFEYALRPHLQSNGGTSILELTVSNAGDRDGADVLQVYLNFPDDGDHGEPPHRLVAFDKVAVPAGRNVTVELPLTPRAFSVWDSAVHAWVEVYGQFQAQVAGFTVDIVRAPPS